ncbi:MAG: immunoglobulin domain-containing protein [Verrucomicrobia bacterium]|nr:immunoglobulin domain-containing protein [Verrucomicrobiota bacterium]
MLRTLLKTQPLVVAVLLQFAPLAKYVQSNPLLAHSPLAIVMQWAVGAAAILGACHAVSGASATITGMERYTNDITGTPRVVAGTLTTNVLGTNGSQFLWRIKVANPGSDTASDYWNCVPLPPGLMINTNLGQKGFITNATPGGALIPGVYPVTLFAGNTACGPSTDPTCFVSNKVTITIVGTGSPPTITAQPTNQTGVAGGSVTFGVTATNALPLFYQWRSNTTALANQTNQLLTLSNLTTNLAGPYSVIVSNSVGSTNSSNATLTVLIPPSVTSPPTNLAVFASGTAAFAVVAAGTQPLGYQWRKDGSALSNQTATNLTLNNVTSNDTGGYTVVVTNLAGGTTSAPPATLSVVYQPVLIPWLSNVAIWMDFDQYPGATYALQQEGQLGQPPWLTLSNVPAVGAPTRTTVTDGLTNGARFYLMKVSIP